MKRSIAMLVPAILAGTLSMSAWSQTSCAAADGGRLLASGCAQCHGTDGRSGAFDTLAGDSQLDTLKKLQEMRAKAADGNVMTPHARGYTNAQLACITLWFSKQPKP